MAVGATFDADMGRAQAARALAESVGEERAGAIDLDDFELAYAPASDTARAAFSPQGRRVVFHYVAKDAYPPKTFWDQRLRHGVMHVGEAALAMERLCAARGVATFWFAESDGKPILGDEATGRLYVPPKDVQDKAKAGASRDEVRAACGGHMRSYVAWRDGALCGIVSETFRVDAEGRLDHVDTKPDWCVLDPETAAIACAARVGRGGQERPEAAPAPGLGP